MEKKGVELSWEIRGRTNEEVFFSWILEVDTWCVVGVEGVT